MTSRLGEINLDCTDPEASARFWCAALGWVVVDHQTDHLEIAPAAVDRDERRAAMRRGAVPTSIVLALVPEPKTTKNRLHLDLTPVDVTHEVEVTRLLALGATRVDVGQAGDEPWTVLADPDGNEFCVLRSLVDGESSPAAEDWD